MAWRKLLPLCALLLIVAMYQVVVVAGGAQMPTYGIGRAPTADEVKAWDIAIGPEGKELPPGRGTPAQGAELFVNKGCTACHGKTGSGGPAPTLIKSDTVVDGAPCLAPCVNNANTIALHSPYATVMWDYINRGMPLGKEQTLKPDEVYSIVAFLLNKNGVIKDDEVMDQTTLPKVTMPNAKGWALPPQEWKHGQPRLAGYP
jgi:cytochrome c